jgi:hypothetical protein
MHLLLAFMKRRFATVGKDLFEELASDLGYLSRALVQRNAKMLVERSLVQETWIDLSGSPGQKKRLLTDLGELLVAERVEKYNSFKNQQATH